MVSVRSGEKGEKSTHVGSSNNPVWDDPGVIPRLGTVRYHFRLDIPYQISAHRRDIAGTPETKVVDAVEGDEARLGALVDIGADGGELGGVGVRGAVGVGGSHLRPCEGGEGEEGREEGEGEHGGGGWKGRVERAGGGNGGGERGTGAGRVLYTGATAKYKPPWQGKCGNQRGGYPSRSETPRRAAAEAVSRAAHVAGAAATCQPSRTHSLHASVHILLYPATCTRQHKTHAKNFSRRRTLTRTNTPPRVT